MGGEAPSAREQTGKMLQSYIKYLPQLLNVTSSQDSAIAQQQFNAANQVSPQYSQLGLDQMRQFGVPYAEAGNEIGRVAALGSAATNREILNGVGSESASAADALNRRINPEWYSTRTAASDQIGNLLRSIDLGGLSGGERAEVERSLNQSNAATGNLGVNNATNTVSNAMNFGNALNTKRTMLGQALGTATNFMANAQNANFNPVSLALGNSQSNIGTSNLTPITTPANQSFGFGQGVLGNISNQYAVNQPLAAGASAANSPMGIFSGVTSGIGNICCFIFLESYNGVLPWWVRICRDYYYNQEPAVATGYKRMAKWLVPIMRSNRFVRWLVNKTMVTPITKFGGWLCDVDGYQQYQRYGVVKNFWFSVWRKLAK